MKSPITTHVLDTSTGMPAVGLSVTLERSSADTWVILGRSVTGPDGRATDLTQPDAQAGIYRLSFDTATYFAERASFFPFVRVAFHYEGEGRHCHVPLLINPFGYTTYRGT